MSDEAAPLLMKNTLGLPRVLPFHAVDVYSVTMPATIGRPRFHDKPQLLIAQLFCATHSQTKGIESVVWKVIERKAKRIRTTPTRRIDRLEAIIDRTLVAADKQAKPYNRTEGLE